MTTTEGYGSVSTEETATEGTGSRRPSNMFRSSLTGGNGCVDRFWRWFYDYLQGGYIDEDHQAQLLTRKPPNGASPKEINVHAESVRQIAYLAFWFMVICAKFFTWALICNFQREEECPVIYNSDLKDMFGYNNICVYWDYSPSRELVAMIYPLFEYSFFLYVVFDYIHLRLACPNVPGAAKWLQTLGNWLLPLKLVLIAWFRMIFVYTVYDTGEYEGPVRGVVGHTMSFFGVQGALILVAFENILYINLTNISYPLLGLRWTKILSWVYLCFFIPNTIFQMWFAFSIFWYDPILDVSGPNPNPVHIWIIYLVDRMWLILVGIMPLFFAQIGRKTQAFMRVTFELDAVGWQAEGEQAGDVEPTT